MTHTVIAAGPDTAVRRVLFVGDSWVSGDKLLNGSMEAMGPSTRSVGLCFSGYTSRQILASLRGGQALQKAIAALGGPLTEVVILAGLNDAISHQGSASYANNIASLVDLMSAECSRVLVVELPRYNTAWRPDRLRSRVRNYLFRWIQDAGRNDVVMVYRQALRRQTNAMIIPFDPFIPKAVYYPDGVHLRDKTDLGRYLGAALGAPHTTA